MSSSPSLVTHFKKLYSEATAFDVIREFAKDPTPGGIITMCAVLDIGLENVLKSRMRKLNSEDTKRLFGATGTLSGFASKVRVAYAFGIIGQRTANDLYVLNDIRNGYAHAPLSLNLEDEKVQKRAKDLHLFSHFDDKGENADWPLKKKLARIIAIYVLLLAARPISATLGPPLEGDMGL